jgi:hypothetical protein
MKSSKKIWGSALLFLMSTGAAHAGEQDKVIAIQQARIEQLTQRLNELEARLKDGRLVVGQAKSAERAASADRAVSAVSAGSADRAASAANADSANRIFTDQEARFFVNTSGSGGYMLVLEKMEIWSSTSVETSGISEPARAKKYIKVWRIFFYDEGVSSSYPGSHVFKQPDGGP